MPVIVPVRDLKDTNKISELCNRERRPIFVTKNGYGDMVVMSMEAYEKTMFINDVERKLAEAEDAINRGEVRDAKEALAELKKKYAI